MTFSWWHFLKSAVSRPAQRQHTRPHGVPAQLYLESLEDRVTPSAGALDTSFSADGMLTTDFGTGADSASEVAIDGNGKIVVAGSSFNGANYDFALARYNQDGTLDTTFGGTGKVTTAIGSADDGAGGVAIQANGKIVVAGYSSTGAYYDFALARYNQDGSLDTTFDTDGKLTTAFGSNSDIASSLAIDGNGKIVVAGSSFNGANWDFALARYNQDGSLDASFDADGMLTTAFGASRDEAFSVAIDGNGKIVVAGSSFTGVTSDFALARYNQNGTLDTTFGGTGKVTTAFGPAGDEAYSVAIQANGKIVVAGYSSNGASDEDFALARYNQDGSLDASFDSDGKLTDFGFSDDVAVGVAIDANGKIVVAGNSSNGGAPGDFALVRYNQDGSLDTTFGGTGKVTTAFGNSNDYAEGVAIDANGKIVVAGYSWNGTNEDFALARYNDNNAPTNISLSGSTVTENSVSSTVVGTISASDPDAGDTHTFTLVAGVGATDNGSFQIVGNDLRTNAIFDFETQSTFSIRVRATDAGGLAFEKVFTVNVSDAIEQKQVVSHSAVIQPADPPPVDLVQGGRNLNPNEANRLIQAQTGATFFIFSSAGQRTQVLPHFPATALNYLPLARVSYLRPVSGSRWRVF